MVSVYEDNEGLSRGVARLFAEQARQAVEERGRFLVLLSGGATPLPAYELLAKEPLRGQVPWQSVQFFWGDERWVPPDDPHSNQGMARRALLDLVPVDEEQLHPVPYAASPRASALAYESMLRGFFDAEAPRFDLVLLGLGEDGHTASLFPGSPALEEGNRWACEVFRSDQELHRVTVTAQLINQAALVAFVVAGREKAAILSRVLEGGGREPLPAQLISPTSGKLVWLADRPAARLLDEKDLR